MINICLVFILTFNTLSKQIFYYNDEFYLNREMTLFFSPYDIIEIHLKEGRSAFLSELQEGIYLDIEAINSKGDAVSYGSYKRSNRISGVYFYNRKSVLKFTNYVNNYSSITILFGNSDQFPGYSAVFPNIYPAFYYKDFGCLGKPILYAFAKDEMGLIALTSSFLILASFLIFSFICNCCCSCCEC